MSTSLQDVVCVGPRVADILNLPPRSQILYMVGASTLGFMFHVAVMRGVRYVHNVATKGQDYTLRDESCHPRLVLSAVLRAVLANASAAMFEWAYANVPVVAKAVAGAVWGMRRAVGLPGTAPYGELSGGTPLVNVLAGAYELERMYNGYFPIPTIGAMGINAKPLTTEQTAEIFAPVGGNPEGLPLRFLTPTRLVRFALQFSIGNVAVHLFRRYVVPMVTGVPNHMRKPRSMPTTLSNPLILLIAMAILRDAESVSLFGTRWQVGLVGVCSILIAPMYMVAELVAAVVVPAQPMCSEEEYPVILDEIVADYLPEIPISYMSPMEVAMLQENFGQRMSLAIGQQLTSHFMGGLAVMSVILFSYNSQENPLTAYESSLERINADLADAVMERQASVVSVDGDATTNETCPICLRDERPVSQDMLRVKSCKHEFHTECLTKWLAQSQECPLCRAKIERDMPADVKEQLTRWNGLSDEDRADVLGKIHLEAANRMYDVFSLDHRDFWTDHNLPRCLGMSMITIKDAVDLGGMGTLLTSAEDLACMVVAPTLVDPLFPAAFNEPMNYMWLPRATNHVQLGSRYALLWLHLFPSV